MKIATIIIVIIGVLATAGLGVYWVTDYNSAKEDIATLSKLDMGDEVQSLLDDAEKQKNSGYALMIGAALSLVAVLLIGKLKKISAILILIAAIAPAIIYPNALIATFLLIIGGILAFFVKPKVAAVQV
jgi:hypothetical protein